jgi:aryl-alcohol dehydrogenase-like predicted oxidoreductase
MCDWPRKVALGKTGLEVSRLGLGSSYPAPARAYERAFDRGVNYFYWGSRRSGAMGSALRTVLPRARDATVVVVQSYARLGFWVKRSVEGSLRKLGIDHADVLLLGWYNDPPSRRILDAALSLRERGLVRHLALSGHRRSMFPELLGDDSYAIWHLRYNAVHRGAESDVFPALDAIPHERRPGVVTYTTTRWGHLCDPKRTPTGERTPTGTDCYRFALSDPHVDVAIAGPANEGEMDQALRALDLGPMNDDELAWMRRVGDHIYGRDRTSKVRDVV